jgi:transposase
MRSKGTAAELERRRQVAVARVQEGYEASEVAEILGVHPTSVRSWWRAYCKHGDAGLKAKPHLGRSPKLSAARERQVLGWFHKNPKSFGFATELWTAPRIAHLIERKWGIHFHPRYINEWLTARAITPQKPQRRPRQRDPQVIERWKRYQWPRIQNERAA